MTNLERITQLLLSNRLPEAEAAARDAIRSEASAEMHNLLGNILNAQFRLNEAKTCYQEALRLDPDFFKAWNNIGNILNHEGMVDDAIAHYRKALELNPHLPAVHSNLLLSMYYSASESLQTIFSETQRWYRQQCDGIEPTKAEGVDLRPEKRLTVGYVSGDLWPHPVGYFLQAILENHDRQGFRVICYATANRPDNWLTQILQKHVEWRQVEGWDDDALHAAIKKDGVDILVDLSGHTAMNRLRVFARRAAPVQVSWLGFHGTTGVPAMDYHLTDAWTVPAGEEKWYTEEVIRLEGSRFCYAPPRYAPKSARARGEDNTVVFGSFNNLAKITPMVASTWSRILKEVKGSKLLLKWHTLASPEVREKIVTLFGSHDITPEQLILRPGSSHADMLREYGDIDIALDPFPYSGGLTSCEALYSGVPVVTLSGDRPVGRQTAAFLHLLELEQLIASDHDDYVDKAAALARNSEERKTISSMLPFWASSSICDGRAFTLRLESTYRELWSRFCRK
ncbi:O-linked N-acetylglucosamine transferase, SPINDLY family protein [Geomonas anaerohicana]|uniref:protein O-GlcNAc transferase n=1 Tax=Geomonas anaerohicana TaxID=2798583 RepID=A0ABS0YAW0_9BACT|nr:glycosyltransferase family 41 protein [Geomonas anaerohicana]MBJ6749089.1 tetratricopeptide repeat protein [Geomonas anaerohicana]